MTNYNSHKRYSKTRNKIVFERTISDFVRKEVIKHKEENGLSGSELSRQIFGTSARINHIISSVRPTIGLIDAVYIMAFLDIDLNILFDFLPKPEKHRSGKDKEK